LQSLIKRCFELGVITKSTYVDFMGEFTKQGWKKKEPGDEVLPESSFRFQLLLRRAIAENLITPSQTMELLKIVPSRSKRLPSLELQKLAADAKDLYKDEELTIFTDSNVEDFYGYED